MSVRYHHWYLKKLYTVFGPIGQSINLIAWEFVWGGILQKNIGGVPRYGHTVYCGNESDNPETMPDC